ncbi:MAG: ribosome maturation factor RimM [Sporomusaceae bacterium]|nr:ribosome maturation factor RimM [Sporomusaceae bacterium]
MRPEFISVGKIVAPHGVRGDLRIMALTDDLARFEKLQHVFLEQTTKLTIESVKYHKGSVLLKFKEHASRNDVESLRGKLLYITQDQLIPLPEGRYYHFDLIGLSVYDEAGQLLGTLKDILETGSNDVYVVEAEDVQSKPILVPALKKVVKSIDLTEQKMIVKLQEEWDD